MGQWYAARDRMRRAGTWTGERPTHSVPALEEGEPPAQQPRLEEAANSEDSASPGTPDSLPELEASPTAEGMSFQNGFSVLAWVREDSPLILTEFDEDARARLRRQLLLDFCTLLGIRWNLDMNMLTINGAHYAYGCCGRFTVSDRTIRNAIGDLTEHVDFTRGSPQHTADQLADFKACKEKWRVPEQVTESASGWDPQEPATTSTGSKRKRF
ncbi:hypothetical protein [Psittaciform chaphamaparvovirus 3]|nr:hypothetical protein [Psittaciform chaphamaparvovirus 3]